MLQKRYTLSQYVKKYRQKISQNIEDLNNTIGQPDLPDIYRTPDNSRVCMLYECSRTVYQDEKIRGSDFTRILQNTKKTEQLELHKVLGK